MRISGGSDASTASWGYFFTETVCKSMLCPLFTNNEDMFAMLGIRLLSQESW